MRFELCVSTDESKTPGFPPGVFLSKPSEEYPRFCKWRDEFAPDSIALQQSLRHLDTAYSNFFKQKGSGHPRFKSRKRGKQSYTTVSVNNNIRLEDGRIRLPKLGAVKIRQHRQVPEGWAMRSVTVRRVPSIDVF